MKIYSSELLNDTVVDAGSLTITDSDILDVTQANDAVLTFDPTSGLQSTSTAATEGLVIGGTFDTIIGATNTATLNDGNTAYYYISGTGVEKNLLDVVIAQGAISGTNLVLSNKAGDQLVPNIDLSGIASAGGSGGAAGGGADTNPDNHFLPVKFQDDVGQNIFLNSVVEETGTFTDPTTTTGEIDGAVTSGSMADIDSIPAGDQTAFHTRFSGGGAATIIIDGASYVGTLTSTASGATATFVLSSGTFTGANELADNASVTLPLVAGSRTVEGLNINTNLTLHGDLQVIGSSTSVNMHQVNLNDSFIVLNHTETPGNYSEVDGGVIVTHTHNAGTFTYAGIRYNGNVGDWEIANDLDAPDGSDGSGTWLPISTRNAVTTTQKAVVTVAGLQAGAVGTTTATFNNTATADVGDITVTAPSAGGGAVTVAIVIQGNSTLLPIDSQDATVQVFEDGSMIIPDSIAFAEAGGVVTVTVTLPDGYASGAAVSLKTVIIG